MELISDDVICQDIIHHLIGGSIDWYIVFFIPCLYNIWATII